MLWSYPVLTIVSNWYPSERGRLLTRYSPVRHSVKLGIATNSNLVRLACLKHTASVRPEPESNSYVLILNSIDIFLTIKVCIFLLVCNYFSQKLTRIFYLKNLVHFNILICQFASSHLHGTLLIYQIHFVLSILFSKFLKKLFDISLAVCLSADNPLILLYYLYHCQLLFISFSHFF